MTLLRRMTIAGMSVTLLSVVACSSSTGEATDAVASGSAGAVVTSDCAVGAPGQAQASAPDVPSVSEGVWVQWDGDGAPVVSISDGAPAVSELVIADLAEGTGPAVVPGGTLTVNYCGVGLVSGEIFDSSWVRGEPITFPLDGLIRGWIEGLPGMRVGGKRVLVIPGELAYGANPPPGIEPNETLAFAIELTAAS